MRKYKIIAHVDSFIGALWPHMQTMTSAVFLLGIPRAVQEWFVTMHWRDFGKRKKRAIYLDQQDSGAEIALSIRLMSILDIYFFERIYPGECNTDL